LRIVLAGPPHSGETWLEELLADAFGL